MSLRRGITAIAIALLAGCVNETGALCIDDTNCPNGQACVASACTPIDAALDAGCAGACGLGLTCSADRCVPLTCDGGQQCPASLQCVNGYCANDTCAPSCGSFICLQGICLSPTGSEVDAGPFVPAPHAARPLLVTDGGRSLNPLVLVTILTGGDPLASDLSAFGSAFSGSGWLSQVGAEYGVGPVDSNSQVVTGPAMPVPDGGIRIADALGYIDALLDAGTGVPAPNGRTVYLLFLPPNLFLNDTTDSAFRDPYPSLATSAGDDYAVVQRVAAVSDESQLDRLTKLASEEILDSAIDPLLEGWGSGAAASPAWTGTTFAAIGFSGAAVPCTETSIVEALDDAGTGSFAYDRIYSNAAARAGGDPCLPAVATPYFNVSTADGWYAPTDAGSWAIPITGWATGRTVDAATKQPDLSWFLGANVSHAVGGLSALQNTDLILDAGLGQNGDCSIRPQIDNGGSALLQLAVPPDAGSGDYAVLAIQSFFTDPNNPQTACADPSPEAGDQYHQWYVGIYLP